MARLPNGQDQLGSGPYLLWDSHASLIVKARVMLWTFP